MEKFNIEEYFAKKSELRKILTETEKLDNKFCDVFSSKKNRNIFLKYYTGGIEPDSVYDCKLHAADKEGYYYIEWHNWFHGEEEIYHTKDISGHKIIKFLSSDDYFGKIYDRLKSMKESHKRRKEEERKKKQEEKNAEKEYEMYLKLKGKYENI